MVDNDLLSLIIFMTLTVGVKQRMERLSVSKKLYYIIIKHWKGSSKGQFPVVIVGKSLKLFKDSARRDVQAGVRLKHLLAKPKVFVESFFALWNWTSTG